MRIQLSGPGELAYIHTYMHVYVDGAEMSAEKGASRLNDVALYCPSSLFAFVPALRTVLSNETGPEGT